MLFSPSKDCKAGLMLSLKFGIPSQDIFPLVIPTIFFLFLHIPVISKAIDRESLINPQGDALYAESFSFAGDSQAQSFQPPQAQLAST